MQLNSGYFSKTKYDTCAYKDAISESTMPFTYTMDTNRIYNCNGCLTGDSPRSGYLGAGTSTVSSNRVAAAQQNIDVDSVMSNRNMHVSKCKKAQVNTIKLEDFKTVDYPSCPKSLNTQHSRLTDSTMFYRGAAINRFYELNRDPQANIFYDWSINTSLQAKDTYVPSMPTLLNQL